MKSDLSPYAAISATAQAENLSDAAIKAFRYNFEKLTSGANLNIAEADIDHVDSIPSYDSLS